MEVYVVTGLELGWDCVVGVYAGVTMEQLDKVYPSNQYVITLQTVETKIEN